MQQLYVEKTHIHNVLYEIHKKLSTMNGKRET